MHLVKLKLIALQDEQTMTELFNMIWLNIFRSPNVAVTRNKNKTDDGFAEFGDNIDGGDENVMMEEAWPHL